MRKQIYFSVHCLSVLLFFASLGRSRGEDSVSAKTFAGPDGKLNQQQAALYIIYRDKEPLSKFISPGQNSFDPTKLVDVLGDKIDNLQSKTGHEAPWTWEELDKAFPTGSLSNPKPPSVPALQNISGFTKKLEFSKSNKLESLGPILIRNGATDLTKSLSDAKGATLSYSRNGLTSGSGALTSQGSLTYPSMWDLYQGGQGRSVEGELDLATDWNIAQVQNNHSKNVEELTFSVPGTLIISPGDIFSFSKTHAPTDDAASSGIILAQGKPYYLTDFSFRDKIYGVSASIEYVGNVFGSRLFALGGYQNIGDFGLQYQAHIIPNLDYSVTERGGNHTRRMPGDDWVRLGGTVSLDLRYGLKTFKAVDAGVLYQCLQTVSGSGGYSRLFTAHTTLWVIENLGLTLQYSKGETPVAAQATDLITLGVEFKY